jgi:hypothetical protein
MAALLILGHGARLLKDVEAERSLLFGLSQVGCW